ncbi:P1 family peptidase [Roseateles sp. DAIF2]|uniref:DmpA family aminopeptidase n=1 Tax=Roseateles sp. DAIF2 TaxID=2714952 RepID=UPI0018A2A2FE|nr:P1 family peptidase [Roseateles sp. DAIF2]QPF72444.1 P1 family peptidase [Roseateles sp. DAIF2]
MSQAPRIGTLPSGPLDLISDVAGVSVGHCTLAEGPLQTGVTVVRPHAGDPFRDRVPAAAVVLNGFGKSIGLVQLEELGVLETPIALTNTFAVGAVAQAQIRACVAANPQSGRRLSTVNPLVFECNDGQLNDIQALAVGEAQYRAALEAAAPEFAQGAVGAGRGMSSFGVKGGIGSASRIAGGYMVGALVLSNYGRPEQLTLAGRHLGAALSAKLAELSAEPEKGSIIMLLATDAPLDARQLRRLALRAGAGLARTGSVFGHGSGDIALAFSSAYTLPQDPARPMPAVALLHDAKLDPLFQAAADATEQAIVQALWQAETVEGRDGQRRLALRELLQPDELAP